MRVSATCTGTSPARVASPQGAERADNRLALNAGWNDEALATELAAIEAEGFDLAVIGFTDRELEGLLAEDAPANMEPPAEEEIPEAPAVAVTQPGDLWLIGPHRLICGDCRDHAVVDRLFDGARANVVFTSPPYVTQREYDPSGGFQPVPPEEYSDWFRDVAANVRTVLAENGSYFLNIKEHGEDGERNLYVKDLTIAHKREWGWRFVDEFCWRKTDNGVPGGWGNRFKNAWEPIHHFCHQAQIKFRPEAVSHASDDVFDYSPDNPKSTSGSGLLGSGPRLRHEGMARPSNVIEVRTESNQGSHSAPFPRAAAAISLAQQSRLSRPRPWTRQRRLLPGPARPAAGTTLQEGRQKYRAQKSVFDRLRPPGLLVEPTSTTVDTSESLKYASSLFMPQMSGDGGDATVPQDNSPEAPSLTDGSLYVTWLTLSETQFNNFKKWAADGFDDDWTGSPTPVKPIWEYPVAEQPAMIDKGALDPCVGAAFYPGIEITYIANYADTWSGLCRLNPAIPPRRRHQMDGPSLAG